MESLPPEVCEQIFSFACSDDGTTARSLSLVSKYAHATSKPFQFRSVKVCGVQNIVKLAERLKGVTSALHHIHHLHLKFHTDMQSTEQPPAHSTKFHEFTTRLSTLIPGGQPRRGSRDSQEQPVHPELWHIIHKAIWDIIYIILPAAAPTLQSLRIQHTSTEDTYGKLRRLRAIAYFPSLHTVILEVNGKEWEGWLAAVEGYHYPTSYTSMRVLDLANFRNSMSLTDEWRLFGNITNLAPQLTHLRIHLRESRFLRRALGHASADPGSMDTLPGTIVCVIIQLEYVFDCSATCGDLMVIRCNNCSLRILLSWARSMANLDDRVYLQELGDDRSIEEVMKLKRVLH